MPNNVAPGGGKKKEGADYDSGPAPLPGEGGGRESSCFCLFLKGEEGEAHRFFRPLGGKKKESRFACLLLASGKRKKKGGAGDMEGLNWQLPFQKKKRGPASGLTNCSGKKGREKKGKKKKHFFLLEEGV